MIDKIRLLIMEDNKLLAEGFVDIFKHQQNLEADVCTGDADDLDRSIRRFNPYLILLNSHLKSTDSLKVVQCVIKKYPHLKIVLMGHTVSEGELIEFINAGAAGFILKDSTPQEFIRTLKEVVKGEVVKPQNFADLLLFQIIDLAVNKGETGLNESVHISEFELKLLPLINEGLNDTDIGEILGIPVESVKTSILALKLNLSLFLHSNS